MKYLKILLILLLIGAAALTPLKAVNTITGASAGEFVKVGAAGAQFMKIPVGARASAMANTYGSVADDLTAVFWNPAGLADINTMSANVTYTSWLASFSHNFGALALPISNNYTLAASIVSFNSGDIEITTLDNAQGTGAHYQISDVSIGLSFAGYLTDQFSFGMTMKYINNSFSEVSASGVSFDVGTMYDTEIQGIKLGFSIHNLGTEQTYSGQDLNTTKKMHEGLYASPLDASYMASSFQLPLTFRAGISSDVIKNRTMSLIVAADFVTMSDVSEQFSFGAEWGYKDIIFIRGGYLFGQDQFGIAGGAGIKYSGGGFEGEIDYSISPTFDLGLVNRIGINLVVGG